jgi:hypothetical protein
VLLPLLMRRFTCAEPTTASSSPDSILVQSDTAQADLVCDHLIAEALLDSDVFAMASISDHDMDDIAGGQQASASVAGWSREPTSVAGVDCFCGFVGITAYEHCPLDCVRAKSPQVAGR